MILLDFKLHIKSSSFFSEPGMYVCVCVCVCVHLAILHKCIRWKPQTDENTAVKHLFSKGSIWGSLI
jgi:hypothetical protein